MSAASPPNTMKYRRIAAALRAEILRGELPPGSRLPTRRRLEARFAATPPTVQKAIDLLAARGYVEARGRRGTFVVDHLPGRRQYALAFAWPRWRDVSQFYRGLAWQAEAMSSDVRHFCSFHGLAGHQTEDTQRLRELIHKQQLHGVIFCSNPFEIPLSPLLDEPGLARVSIESLPVPAWMPCVYPDLADFRQQAFTLLCREGRRRLAHLLLAGSGCRPACHELHALSGSFGLSLPDAWIQATAVELPQMARHVVEMWMREAPATRPDAIVVHDDNLLPEATRGLLAAGIRVPEEVAVVGHANFPFPTPSAVPATRLGFDLGTLLESCVERLEQQNRGETPTRQTRLPVASK